MKAVRHFFFATVIALLNSEYRHYAILGVIGVVWCLYGALQNFIEEQHIDFLLHKLDLEEALKRITYENDLRQLEKGEEGRKNVAEYFLEPTEQELERRKDIIRGMGEVFDKKGERDRDKK